MASGRYCWRQASLRSGASVEYAISIRADRRQAQQCRVGRTRGCAQRQGKQGDGQSQRARCVREDDRRIHRVIRCALLVATATLSLLTASGEASRSGSGSCRHDRATRLLTTPARRDPRCDEPAARHDRSAVRPLTRQQTALPVIDEQIDQAGQRWLRVRLPGRPNGRIGMDPGRVRTARLVTVARRRRPLSQGGGAAQERQDRRAASCRGRQARDADATRPLLRSSSMSRRPHGSPLGRWALATSAHSNVLQEFDGGPGQIALHGRARPSARSILSERLPRTAVSGSTTPLSIAYALLPNGTAIEIR